MLTNWLTLRQAQEALNKGRLEEAQRLASQSEVQGHKRAGEILQQVGKALLARAQMELQHEDSAAAWRDLLQAEAAGLHDKAAVRLRQDLVHRSLSEIRDLLSAGEPNRAAEVIQQLRERKVEPPEVRVLDEIVQGWSLAQDLAARGEYPQAVATLERLVRLAPQRFRPLEDLHDDAKRRQRDFEGVQMKLHDALKQADWRDVIQHADQLLALAPQHAEARKARAKAWKAVEPPTVPYVEGAKHEKEPPASREETLRRMLLWIDGVGGYLVCLSPRVSFGQATPDAYVDIPIFADISRLHGYLTRDAEGYLLESVRKVSLNNQPADKALLRDGDRLSLGGGCQMQFHQPVPLSATARLEIASGHRLSLSVDGVLLMAETCILGPAGNAHIVMPDLMHPVVIHRTKDGLGVRTSGEFTIDGMKVRDRGPLGPRSTVAGDDFRFTVEPLGNRLGNTRT